MKKILFVAFAALVLNGCAATETLNPEVNSKVIASTNPAPKGCKYVTQVLGSQGNFFTGAYTSNANLEVGAMNDLKNKAYLAHGNYVQIITNRAGVTGRGTFSSSDGFGFGGSSAQTNVTSTGNVYSCPAKLIGLQ